MRLEEKLASIPVQAVTLRGTPLSPGIGFGQAKPACPVAVTVAIFASADVRGVTNLRREVDKLEFWTKVVNIAAMPIVVIAGGITLAAARRKETAAK